MAAGDVTGDGVAEIITGAGPAAGRTCASSAWRAARRREVASFFAYDPAFPGGVSVAAGDVTGDGVAEIITGAGPGGGPHVRAFSLASGDVDEVGELLRLRPGVPRRRRVAAGDVTGDGVAEIITGAGPGGGPHVRAFSVAGGVVTEVASFFAYDPAFPGGVTRGGRGSQPHPACRAAWCPFPVDAGDSQAARTDSSTGRSGPRRASRTGGHKRGRDDERHTLLAPSPRCKSATVRRNRTQRRKLRHMMNPTGPQGVQVLTG